MRKIIVLSHRSQVSYLLINKLLKLFDVALIVFEKAPLHRQLSLLNRRRKRLGIARVGEQVLFQIWDRLFIRRASRERIVQLLAHHDVSPPPLNVRVLDVLDINASEVVDAIRQAAPACGVVLGTSILKDPIIKSTPVLLNVHAGITPRYRGVHGGFWAVYDGTPELAGVTVHQIDAGIDTGGIVAQAPIGIEARDTYRTLPVKQSLAGVPLVVKAVERVLNGTHQTYNRTDLGSKLWSSPTVREYLVFRRKLEEFGQGSPIGQVEGNISGQMDRCRAHGTSNSPYEVGQ